MRTVAQNVVIALISVLFASCTLSTPPVATETSAPTAAYTTMPIFIPTATMTSTPTPMPWRWSNALITFNDMAILSGSEVWAIGQNGIIIHDRSRVAHLTNPYDFPGGYDLAGGGYLSAIDFVSQDDGWLTAWGGQILHWNGQKWSTVIPVNLENSLVLLDIGFANKNKGWAVGCYRQGGVDDDTAVLMQWDGSSWENVSLSGEVNSGYCLTDMDVVSETNVWVIGNKYQKGIVLNWNGSQWQEIPAHPEMGGSDAVSVTGDSDVWVVDHNNIFYWNNSTWHLTELPVAYWYSENSSASPDVLAVSQENVWVGGSNLFHWNGSEWKDSKYDEKYGYIVDIEMDSEGDVWALTLFGAVLQLFAR